MRIDHKNLRVLGELGGLALGLYLVWLAFHGDLSQINKILLLIGGMGSILLDSFLLYKTQFKK